MFKKKKKTHGHKISPTMSLTTTVANWPPSISVILVWDEHFVKSNGAKIRAPSIGYLKEINWIVF
jgi:hypothetical protein